jgi:hypothetical protein
LAGKPEVGDIGDLFVPVLRLGSDRFAAAVVLENVAGFGDSLAGRLVVSGLRKLGHRVAATML